MCPLPTFVANQTHTISSDLRMLQCEQDSVSPQVSCPSQVRSRRQETQLRSRRWYSNGSGCRTNTLRLHLHCYLLHDLHRSRQGGVLCILHSTFAGLFGREGECCSSSSGGRAFGETQLLGAKSLLPASHRAGHAILVCPLSTRFKVVACHRITKRLACYLQQSIERTPFVPKRDSHFYHFLTPLPPPSHRQERGRFIDDAACKGLR